jgi:hypothetical protein
MLVFSIQNDTMYDDENEEKQGNESHHESEEENEETQADLMLNVTTPSYSMFLDTILYSLCFLTDLSYVLGVFVSAKKKRRKWAY